MTKDQDIKLLLEDLRILLECAKDGKVPSYHTIRVVDDDMQKFNETSDGEIK